MATNLRDAFKNLSGRDITDPEIQRIMAAAQALGVRNDDPMIMMLMVLEHNHGIVNAAPERIKKTLKDAEQSAHNLAVATFERATSELIPGIKDAVSSAARESVVKVQLGASMITLFFGVLMLGFTFIFGMLWGSKIIWMLNTGVLNADKFWDYIGVYIVFALVTPAMLITAIYGDDLNLPGFLSICCGIASFLIITFYLVMLGLLSYFSFIKVAA